MYKIYLMLTMQDGILQNKLWYLLNELLWMLCAPWNVIKRTQCHQKNHFICLNQRLNELNILIFRTFWIVKLSNLSQ